MNGHFRSLWFVVLAMLLFSQNVSAQNSLAKWMPSVGDVFIYDDTASGGGGGHSDYYTCVDTCTIVATDVFVDSNRQHVVRVESSGPLWRTKDFNYFPVDGGAPLPFTIASYQGFSSPTTEFAQYDDYTLPFSTSKISTVIWDSIEILSGIARQDLGGRSYEAEWTPYFRWLLRESYELMGPGEYVHWSRSLKAAITAPARVAIQHGEIGRAAVFVKGKYLVLRDSSQERVTALVLMDALGRDLRQWTLTLQGSRDVTLYVGDLSPGVYYLRTGNGETHRVALLP